MLLYLQKRLWIFVVIIPGKEIEWWNSSMTSLEIIYQGGKKIYVFLPIVKEMGDFCSVVFSNYIWICIWICVIEISLGEKTFGTDAGFSYTAVIFEIN